jgi:hypothetical protein
MGEQLTWFDRTGRQSGTIGNPGLHLGPQISPDGQTLADDLTDPETFAPQIWLLPITKGTPTVFTFRPSDHPIWSGDGARIAYGLLTSALYTKTTVGLENEELVLEAAHIPGQTVGDDYRLPCDWSEMENSSSSSERRSSQVQPLDAADVWRPQTGLTPAQRFQYPVWSIFSRRPMDRVRVRRPGQERDLRAGFAEKAPGAARKWQVSYHGGTWPKWRRDGKELFFLDVDRKMVAMDVMAGATFEHGPRGRCSTPES